MFCSGLPHLAVSNSTPPPSTSPSSVKVKSEPVSPPRDHHSHQNNLIGQNQSAITTLGNVLLQQTLNINHQQHLIMHTRPSSTGHLTPASGKLTFFLLLF